MIQWLLVLLVIALAVRPAEAHLVSSGLGPFHDGALHLASSPDDLLGIASVALLAGSRGPSQGRTALLVLPASWLVGLLAGGDLPGGWQMGAQAILILAAAGSAALDLDMPRWGIAVAVVLGLCFGAADAASFAPSMRVAEVAGIIVTLVVVLALALGIVLALTPRLGRIPTRVVASWIAATGLLMAGWAWQDFKVEPPGHLQGPPSRNH